MEPRRGFEPLTRCVQSSRSVQTELAGQRASGQSRTDYLALTKRALWPCELRRHSFRGWTRTSRGQGQSLTEMPVSHPEMVAAVGLEPTLYGT